MICRNLVAHPSGSRNVIIIGSNLRSVSPRHSYSTYCLVAATCIACVQLSFSLCAAILSLFSRYKRKCIVVSLNLFSQRYVLLSFRVNWPCLNYS